MARFTTRHPLFLSALAATAVLTTACSGPGGVDLGKDWKGSTTFVLAKVDGLVTVVGINPDKAHAESLAVVPQQADDDDSVSPQIVELADGRRLLTVPRKGNKPDRRYELDRTDHVLDGMKADERLRRILPGKTLVAEVAGLPDTKSAQDTTASSVLVKNPANWTTERELKIPGTIGLAASDPAADRICLAGDTKVFAADLTTGKVAPVAVPSGLDVQNLACPGGHPVIVGASGTSDSPGTVKATLKRTDAATTVSVTGGRVDAVATTGSSLLLAAATGDDTEIVELDTTTGKELHRARVKGVAASLDVTAGSAGWLLYTEKSVTRVDPATGRTKTFDLPGTLLDS
ncbi:hypothetical protein ADK57_41335 [Streptomyces sp. MMG1533]|uniref:hypothetical protein n=1 Tax=Streptomyces sp. MMG1533 TaxID=1415546 RepID=UPI0006ADF554|nr:hypothetical protein [Streptomyces sp. MMG1533]KOU56728.1 hypothetical protein ADK57_41335 [Streptomyces sp. MMG1533]